MTVQWNQLIDKKQHLAMNHAKQKLEMKRDKKDKGLFLPVVNFRL
jgi:hypothetical protein